MKSVSATFQNNSRTYEYLVPQGDMPVPGDVVVTSISFTQERYSGEIAKCAVVVNVNEIASPQATKFYVQLVSLQGAKDRCQQNKEYKERAQKIEAARAALDEKVRMMDRMSDYEKLAMSDPEAAEMLAILKGAT